MRQTLLAIAIGIPVFFAVAGTIDLIEGGVLSGRKRFYWLLVIWCLPVLGFFIYRRYSPSRPLLSGDETSTLDVDDVGDAMDALLRIPDQD